LDSSNGGLEVLAGIWGTTPNHPELEIPLILSKTCCFQLTGVSFFATWEAKGNPRTRKGLIKGLYITLW